MALGEIFFVMEGMPRDYGLLFYRSFLYAASKARQYRTILSPDIYRKYYALQQLIEHVWMVEEVDLEVYRHSWPGNDIAQDR
jgi:hypothetical protein